MRTPGLYSEIKVATQRNQLPNQAHKIIFINTDVPKEIPPTDIFDTVEADAKARPQSNAGRMMAAALMVSQGVDVEMATWTRRREDINCNYKETFSMPFKADGTATANLYYNHKSHLQTASMTIRQDSASTSYEFLGGAVPGDKEDIVGCSLLAGRVVDGMAEFTIYGFSKDAYFDDGKFDAVEVLLALRPYLTRKMVRIDEKFEFADVISAASAGIANSEGDVYPHLTEPLVNSCCELVIIDGDGDGDGDGGGGSGTGGDGTGGSGGGIGSGDGDGTGGSDDNSGGGETTPTMQHFFAGHPGYYFEDPNNEMLSFDDAKAKGLSRLPAWIETGMQQFTDSMDLSLVDNYKIEHTGYVEVVISSPNNPNHYIGSITGLTHEQLIKGAKRTPEVMYSSKKWRAEGGYYAVDTWAMSLSFEYRVTYTLKSSGEFVEALNMGNADYISIREKAVTV